MRTKVKTKPGPSPIVRPVTRLDAFRAWAGPIVGTGQTTALGVRSTFQDAWRQRLSVRSDLLNLVMETGLPSDGLSELYAWFKTAPYPRRWKRGQPIPSAAFGAEDFSVTNYDYGLRIEWHKNDEADDRTNGLFKQASAGGRNWGSLMERFFFEMITGTADLLPAIPNAPDGAAMYATVDGAGDARFGVTNGNLLTGAGVATGDDVRSDFWKSHSRFKRMQDREGQPLWDEGFLDDGFVIIYSADEATEDTFREAFIQTRPHSVVSSTGAAVTSTVLESGIKLKLWSTSRLSGNDWYVFAIGAEHKAVFEQLRQALESHDVTMDNDSEARKTKEVGVQWDSRHGIGGFLPYQTVKVNN